MKKILLIVLLAMIPLAMSFADVTSIDGTVISVNTIQSGGVYVKAGTDEVYLNPEQRNKFIDILKAHADLLAAISSEKITLKENRFVGTYKVSITASLDFWVYINNYKSLAGVIEISMKPPLAKFYLDLERLNTLIKELEATKAQTDTNLAQKQKIDELVNRARSSLGS